MPITRYTKPQIRARVAALEIAADHLAGEINRTQDVDGQFADICARLRREAIRLKTHHSQHPQPFQLSERETEIRHILDTQTRYLEPTPPPANPTQ
jgi:hypothetical protein